MMNQNLGIIHLQVLHVFFLIKLKNLILIFRMSGPYDIIKNKGPYLHFLKLKSTL